MYWEIWDLNSKNVVDTFDSEDEALQGVRELLATNRPELVDDLALGAMYDEDEIPAGQLPPALTGVGLRDRLGETAPVHAANVAILTVDNKIRHWLTEEDWHVESVPVSPGSFNIVAVHPDGRAINILQHRAHLDHITLSLQLSRTHLQETVGNFPDQEFEDTVWNIYRDITVMGVEFHGIEAPSTMIKFRTYVYLDGLTKDTLMLRVQLVNRAYTLAMRSFVRILQAPGNSGARDLSPEDLRRIVRPVPQVDTPLTATG